MPSPSDLQPISKIAKDFLGILESRGEEPELKLKSMRKLNEILWGIQKKKLIIIGARASNGKSAFAINIALDLACQGKRVMFLSLEMPKESVIERMFCLNHRVKNNELLSGQYKTNQEIMNKYQRFIESTKNWKLLIADCIGRDWEWFDKYILESMKDKPDCVIIDHIQEIRGGQGKKEAIDEYISKMREIAIRNNFALIMCSQINRASAEDKSKEPMLHQLKGTGYLEEAADQVILLHWPHHYAVTKSSDINDFQIHVAKNRNGKTGYIKMKYLPEYYVFLDF